jgi:hypothetical protein
MLHMIVFVLGIVGCNPNIEKLETQEDDIIEIQDTAEIGNYSLLVELDHQSVVAGENVSYTVSFLDPEGEMVDDFSWQVSSDIEEGLQWTSKQVIDLQENSEESSEEENSEENENIEEDESSDSNDVAINGVGNIRPLVAGSHDLSFVVEWESEFYLATGTLDVVSGSVYGLDLQLSDIAIQAGEIIEYEVVAVDRFGNDVDVLDVEVTSDDLNVQMDESQITSTVTGIYTVSASIEESDVDGNLVSTTDVEQFQVQPGSAVSMNLVVDQQGDVEINDTLHCEVLIWDAYGNQTNDAWELWTMGSNDTLISYENVTFPFEGEYTIYASVENTNLMDAYGPIFIDSTGPVISIFSPERGAWSTSETWTVTGNVFDAWSSILDVTVNGNTVALEGNGNFTSDEQFDIGVNLVETIAVDSDGNESNDTRAVLYGDFLSGDSYIEDGLTVYIGDNENGLGIIESFGEEMIGDIDIQGLLPPNPVINESSSNEVCWCIWGCCSTVTWYSLDLNIGNVSYGAAVLDLDAKGDGTIDVVFTIPSLSIDWWANGTVIGIGYSGSGEITSSSIVVTANLSAYVDNTILQVDINSVNTAINNLNFDMDGWVYDVISFFGLDGVIEGAVQGAIEDAVSGAIEEEIPVLLEDILQSLEIAQDLDLMGATYSFVGRPSSVTVTEDGIELGLEANISGDQWILPTTGEGSLYAAYESPQWNASSGDDSCTYSNDGECDDGTHPNFDIYNVCNPGTDSSDCDVIPGMGIGISLDFLNQMLYQIWGGGLLNMTLSGDDVGLQGDEVALIFPGASDLRITVDPLLPPVAAPQSANPEQLELQLGDMYLALHNGPLTDQDVRLELYMNLFAPLNLNASATALGVEIGDPIVYFDVVYPEANSMYAESSESILQALIPYLLPTLTDALTEIEIPSIEGFSIGGVSSSTAEGYVRLSGQLQINP